MEDNKVDSIVNSEEELYKKAKRRVEEIKGFYSHLASYVFVIAILGFINLFTSPQYPWFLWVVLGWGIGIFWHAVGVFGFNTVGKEWEEKKIKEYMEKNRKQ